MKSIFNLATQVSIPLTFSFSVALAQEDAGSITVVGDSILSDEVVAFKTGTPLSETPRSITLMTAAQIEQQGIDSISDIIDYTPGVTTSQGEGHRDSVVFRGVRSTADFYVDGLRDDVQYYRSLYNRLYSER